MARMFALVVGSVTRMGCPNKVPQDVFNNAG